MSKNFILYKKARETNKLIQTFLKSEKIDEYKHYQLTRASTSIVLNIAEGNGRLTKADRCNFFVIARGSVQECLAIFDMLEDEASICKTDKDKICIRLIELVKILTKLIKKR